MQHKAHQLEEILEQEALSNPATELEAQRAQQTQEELIEVGKTYSSYAEFDCALETWRKENYTHVSFVDSKRNKNDSSKDKFPYLYRVAQCVHSGKVRQRGKGLRENQSYNTLECPFKLRIVASRDFTSYKVSIFNKAHANHPVGPEAFQLHSRGRRLDEKEVEEFIEGAMIDLKCRPRNVRHAIQKKTGKIVKTQDLQNCVRRVQGNEKKSDIDEVLDIFQDLSVTDPGATLKIACNEHSGNTFVPENVSTVRAIFFQTSAQKELVKNFGTILHID